MLQMKVMGSDCMRFFLVAVLLCVLFIIGPIALEHFPLLNWFSGILGGIAIAWCEWGE